MSYKEKKKVQTFVASDRTGRKFTLDVYQDFEVFDSEHGPERLPLLRSIQWNGNSVKWVSQGKYLIIGHGIELTSDDPKAP